MRLLIVEDSPYVAAIISQAVSDAGHTVIGRATTCDESLTLAEQCDCDAAILDVDVLAATADRVTGLLRDRKIAYVYLAGRPSDPITLPPDAKIIAKPLKMGTLLKELSSMAERLARRPPNTIRPRKTSLVDR